LIEETVNGGEPFIIARSGNPLVEVIALDSYAEKPTRRIGFMGGQIKVPDDFDTMGADEIGGMPESDGNRIFCSILAFCFGRRMACGDARQACLANADLFRSRSLDGIGELSQRVEMEVGRGMFRFDRAAGTFHAVPPLDPA